MGTNLNVNVQPIVDALVQETSRLYEDADMTTWNTLQTKATAFIHAMRALDKLEKNNMRPIVQMIKNAGSTSGNLTAYLNTKNVKSKLYFTQQRYKLVLVFDEALRIYRGQVPKKAIYVHTDKHNNIISSYYIPLEALFAIADKDGRLPPGNLLNKLKADEKEEIEKSKNDFPNPEHITRAQQAYAGAHARLMEFINHSDAKKLPGLLMWKEQKWVITVVNGWGDLKEAYVAAMMKKHADGFDLCQDDPGSPEHYSHKLIKDFFNNFIANVDNTRAVVEEDVVTDDYQYAVKSYHAGLPGWKQYVEIANKIKNRTTLFSPEELNKEIKNEWAVSKRNVIIKQDLDSISNQELQDIINQYNNVDLEAVIAAY